jgi:long-chain acyl-CoA synthetase
VYDARDATFDEDGWIRTGDIGTWNQNGTLSLVDRKENIVKLQGGDVVALGKMEGLYARSQFVQQIYVHGDDTEPCLVAVVLVHPSVVRSFASKPAVRHQFEVSQSEAMRGCG